jgi:hypothetical protein
MLKYLQIIPYKLGVYKHEYLRFINCLYMAYKDPHSQKG